MSSQVNLPGFEPEEWNHMNQHQKVQSIYWDENARFDQESLSGHLDTGDDDTELLLKKIEAAKYANRIVSPKMLYDKENSSEAYWEKDDGHVEFDNDCCSQGSYHGYTENHLLKFASALRFNYTFEMCFKVRSDANKSYKGCFCPCTSYNKKWRKLFLVDCVDEVEKCKKTKLTDTNGILQHLQTMHRRGNCYNHSLSYFYILKLYSDVIPQCFLKDLLELPPVQPEPVPQLPPVQPEHSETQSKATTASRKRKQDNESVNSTNLAHGSSSRQTKLSKKTSSTLSTYPPSSIVCPGTDTTKSTDSSTISSVTKVSCATTTSNEAVVAKKRAKIEGFSVIDDQLMTSLLTSLCSKNNGLICC